MDKSRITWCDDTKQEGGYIEEINGIKTMIMVKKVDGVICNHKGKMNWDPLQCTHCKMIGEDIFSRRQLGAIPIEFYRDGIEYQPPTLQNAKHPACTCDAKLGEYHYASCEIHKMYPPGKMRSAPIDVYEPIEVDGVYLLTEEQRRWFDESKKRLEAGEPMERILANLQSGKIKYPSHEVRYEPPSSPTLLSPETVREGDVLIYRYPSEGCNKEALWKEAEKVEEYTKCKVVLIPNNTSLNTVSIEELRAIREQVNTLIYDLENKR